MSVDDETWTLTDWDPCLGFHCFVCKKDEGPWPTSEDAEAAAVAHQESHE